MSNFSLELRVDGPVTSGGRIPLSEIARVAGELQATIERIAWNLLGGKLGTGRRPKDIVDAVRLELHGFSAGSARLAIRRPDAPLVEHDLLEDSMNSLENGVLAIRAGTEVLPSGFSSQVLDGLIRLSGGIAEGFMTGITLTRDDRVILDIDANFRALVRKLRHATHMDEATIVGLLQMGDFAPSSLRCRIDTLSASIVCNFDESFKDKILTAMDTIVSASGVAEFTSDGQTIRSLDITEINSLETDQDFSLNALTQDQGVVPLTAVENLSSDDPLDDAEFTSFLSDALSARRGRSE